MVFVDLEKACDGMLHQAIWRRMEEKGAPGNNVRTVQDRHHKN